MTIPYRIFRIETSQFAIFPEKFDNAGKVSVNSSFEFSVNKDITNVRVKCNINYSQGDNILMLLELVTFFEIAREGAEEIKNKGRVPVDFLQYMGTIIIGTARGIIHAKTEGTVLNSIVLPPINLTTIIKDDFVLGK